MIVRQKLWLVASISPEAGRVLVLSMRSKMVTSLRPHSPYPLSQTGIAMMNVGVVEEANIIGPPLCWVASIAENVPVVLKLVLDGNRDRVVCFVDGCGSVRDKQDCYAAAVAFAVVAVEEGFGDCRSPISACHAQQAIEA